MAEEPIESVRIMVVEDHSSFRQALAHMLDLEPGFSVVAEAGTLAEARKRSKEKPDVAIVDMALPDGEGTELIRELHKSGDRVTALVLSGSLSRRQYARAVEAGAAGVMHKTSSIEEIVDAVRRLKAGESLLSLDEVVALFRDVGQEREQNRDAKQAVESLSQREREVLSALAEGLDSREIAERLNITVDTERSHFIRIFAKLGVHSRLQALVFAVRHGIVEIH
ncbi:MAG TPA: response regulator transcription factor [Rubrobacteraceae bacterium]|nr:response regulator transcription factor [Rubrobacteraceae bacterium]